MKRIETLSATLLVVGVLSIGFFIYQATDAPIPVRKEVGTRKAQGRVDHNLSTKAILTDWTQNRILARVTKPSGTAIGSLVSPPPSSAGIKPANPEISDSSPQPMPFEMPPALSDVHFRFDRSGLSQETRDLLDQHLAVLQDSNWGVLVQGHTDQEGTIEQNLRVGLYRAKAVKKYLIDHGLEPGQIQVVSLGEFQPICTETTPECQYKNRRVSFSLAHRVLAKPKATIVSATTQINTIPPPVDWHTSREIPEVIFPAPILEAEPPGTTEELVKEDHARGSLKPPQEKVPSLQPHPKVTAMGVDPIFPEPVHSTPPPTIGQMETVQGHN